MKVDENKTFSKSGTVKGKYSSTEWMAYELTNYMLEKVEKVFLEEKRDVME